MWRWVISKWSWAGQKQTKPNKKTSSNHMFDAGLWIFPSTWLSLIWDVVEGADQLKSFWLTLDDTATGPLNRSLPQDHGAATVAFPLLKETAAKPNSERLHCSQLRVVPSHNMPVFPPSQQSLFYVLSSCSFKWLGQTTSDIREGGWETSLPECGSSDRQGQMF